jgi:hypothetical protein
MDLTEEDGKKQKGSMVWDKKSKKYIRVQVTNCCWTINHLSWSGRQETDQDGERCVYLGYVQD